MHFRRIGRYEEKYELWSRLLNASGREIVWEVSWPAYFPGDPTAPSTINLFYKSAAVGHEFRFYTDNKPNWQHVVNIAATAHEWNMQRYHRPGGWAFMDMLEAGNAPLTEAQSRSHFALWVVMAQPLHLGNNVRNMSSTLVAQFTNPEVLRLASDPLGKMGRRIFMSDGRLNGTQVGMAA